jgi:hypothetical protein
MSPTSYRTAPPRDIFTSQVLNHYTTPSTPVSDEDDPVLLLSIAGRPLSMPPFPLEKIEELTRMMGGAGDKGGYDREP